MFFYQKLTIFFVKYDTKFDKKNFNIELCGPKKFIAGRSFSFVGWIQLSFKKRSGAGNIYSASRILRTHIQ